VATLTCDNFPTAPRAHHGAGPSGPGRTRTVPARGSTGNVLNDRGVRALGGRGCGESRPRPVPHPCWKARSLIGLPPCQAGAFASGRRATVPGPMTWAVRIVRRVGATATTNRLIAFRQATILCAHDSMTYKHLVERYLDCDSFLLVGEALLTWGRRVRGRRSTVRLMKSPPARDQARGWCCGSVRRMKLWVS